MTGLCGGFVFRVTAKKERCRNVDDATDFVQERCGACLGGCDSGVFAKCAAESLICVPLQGLVDQWDTVPMAARSTDFLGSCSLDG